LKDNLHHLKQYEVEHPIMKQKGFGLNGCFRIPSPIARNIDMFIISSDGGGWDHVSVSLPSRCPNWPEMSYVKDLFFKEEETVVQYHPKKSEYINECKNCLHLWKKQNNDHELPPSFMIA